MGIKNSIRRGISKLIDARWNIGIGEVDEDLKLHNIRYIKHDHKYFNSWFADPFVIEETDSEIIILAEEMLVHQSRGRIVRLTVLKSDCRLINLEPILDLDTHLSFPNYIRIGEELFIYPENAASGKLYCYKYGNKLTPSNVVLNRPVYDSTIFCHEGVYYLLATDKENANGNILSVYCSNEPLSCYEYVQNIIFNDNIARRAGNVFKSNGKLISPAQVCNKYYGEGVSFQEIEIKDGKLSMKEIKRYYPEKPMLRPGFHTWNNFSSTSNMVVFDGYCFGNKCFHDFYFRNRGLKEM